MESYGGVGGDEKWKLSKKGRSRSGRSTMDAAYCGQLQGTSSSSSSATMLSRSYSASASTTRTRSTSRRRQHHHQAAAGAPNSSSTTSSGLSKKCVDAVKEHRARFYIVRRCVSMLVCWRDH